MQEKNLSFFTTYKRLENLRIKRNWTWEQIAEHLGISRPRIFQVKTGKSNLSKKVLYRLVIAEQEAGIQQSESVDDLRAATNAVALLNQYDQEILRHLANEIRTLNGIVLQCKERIVKVEAQIDAILCRQKTGDFQRYISPSARLEEFNKE